MENIETIKLLVLFCMVFVSLWVFYFWFYWQYRIEETRKKLFELRNELFDYAQEGNIPFENPAYTMLRNAMNSTIRYTHKIDIVTIAIHYFSMKLLPENKLFLARFSSTLGEIESEKVKEKLFNFYVHMTGIVAIHLIKSSLPVMLIMLFFATGILVQVGFHNLICEIKKRFPGIGRINDIAIELG